jgi:hypothetical protein
MPLPSPRTPFEKTVLIGPEITIPGINDLKAPPAKEETMRIERSQHSGVDRATDASLPPARAHEDETMRLEPAPKPDETIRLDPKSEEPS